MITVITPAYNAESYIRECIESVANCGVEEVEHIVIDDGSTDSTSEIVKEFENVVLIRTANCGATAARNLGIAKSTGTYIKFLDADDILVRGSLEKQVAYSENCKGRRIYYGYAEVFDGVGWCEIRKRNCDLDDQGMVPSLILNNIQTSLSLYPRGALLDVGGFNTNLRSRQEWDLNIRLALLGYEFELQDILTIRQRFHSSPTRISNRKLNFEVERAGLIEVFRNLDDLSDPHIIDAQAAYYWKVGVSFIKQGDEKSAAHFFSQASNLSKRGCARHLGRFYFCLCSILGPAFVHKTVALVKSARK